MATQQRQFLKYTFFKVAPSWRALPPDEREAAKQEVVEVLEAFAQRMLVQCYSTVGTRGDCDLMLWTVSDRLEDFQELTTRLFGSRMGPYLDLPYSYLAMTRRSQYVDKHTHEGQEGARLRITPLGTKYLFVYPFVKTRAWYMLPLEERQQMMNTHIKVGHEFPSVRINTGYSFGLDDQEFVVAFETNVPSDFLDLVMKLRETRASEYTLRDTPIFTCIAMTPDEMLDTLATNASVSLPEFAGAPS
ncbi:MAG: chlorite dismutase family protein [Chloroflexi bacterium]|nr:chlorite dismutase family protein [Chloroflexota bacterium]